jgi:hypothetical protein
MPVAAHSRRSPREARARLGCRPLRFVVRRRSFRATRQAVSLPDWGRVRACAHYGFHNRNLPGRKARRVRWRRHRARPATDPGRARGRAQRNARWRPQAGRRPAGRHRFEAQAGLTKGGARRFRDWRQPLARTDDDKLDRAGVLRGFGDERLERGRVEIIDARRVDRPHPFRRRQDGARMRHAGESKRASPVSGDRMVAGRECGPRRGLVHAFSFAFTSFTSAPAFSFSRILSKVSARTPM